jgi:hypothetical protein
MGQTDDLLKELIRKPNVLTGGELSMIFDLDGWELKELITGGLIEKTKEGNYVATEKGRKRIVH